MLIRKATPADSIQVTLCLLLAMEGIVCRMIGEQSDSKAYDFMFHFVSTTENQYSYSCCWVVEEEGVVIAAANVYDGAQLYELRQPVFDYLRTCYGFYKKLEDETQAGEYYLDSLGVLPGNQRRGIGTKLLTFLVDEYVNRRKKTLGLLVDEDSFKARALYEKLGFKTVGKQVLLGKTLDHMQVKSAGVTG